MFTQCTHCQAIFRVNMRELTVSKGLLRCGECLEVFDSSESLSTTMQKPFVASKADTSQTDVQTHTTETISKEKQQTIKALDDWQNSASKQPTQNQIDLRQSPTEAPKVAPTVQSTAPSKMSVKTAPSNAVPEKKINLQKPAPKNKFQQLLSNIRHAKTTLIAKNKPWHLAIVALLAGLLVFQIAYNYRHLYLDTLKYEPEKIQMLNHSVFAHPIEKNVLLISASIENTADFDQGFPILEVKLTNSKAEIVALRRFSPDEYLDNYSANTLLIKNRATSIKLKIEDPGNQATRFQFNFF